MNEYLYAQEQAAITLARKKQRFEDTLKLAADMAVHKGHWCFFEDGTFCQEDSGCPNCEIFLRSKGDE